MFHQLRRTLPGFAVWIGSLILMALMVSCDYEPHETYLREIPDPDLSNLSIDLSNNSNDTLYLFGKTDLSYNAFLEGRKQYMTYVYLDGFQILTLQNYDTTFTIDAGQYEEGQHILKVEIYASAGTGTLADVAGAEQLQLSQEWIAYIDNSAPETVAFTSVGISDGSMMINWERYAMFNFSAYVLEKQYWNEPYNMYSTCWQKEFSDKDATSFRDSTYLGGKIRYRMRIRGGALFSEYAVREIDYVYDPALDFEWIDREQVRVAWRKPLIANSFKDYEVTFRFSNRTVITSIADTAFIVKPEVSFGEIASFSLTVHPKGNRCEGAVPIYKTVRLGDAFAAFTGDKIAYCRETGQYYTREYANDEYSLIRINGATNAIEQTMLLDGEFSVAPNGEYLYITYNNVLRQLDPTTFAVVKTYNLYELGDAYATLAGNLGVSNNHRVALVTYDSNYVVQMPAFKVLYRAAKDYGMGLSPSGNSLVSNGKLWTWNGSAFVEKHSFSDSFRATFRDDETLIKVYYRNKISIQNLLTSQEYSIALQPNADIVAYDPVSDLIGYAQESSSYDRTTPFHLIDMQANSVKQFTVAQLDNHRGQHMFLINNRILCSQGSSMPVSYYYP